MAAKDDDRDMFKEAMRGVRPLATTPRAQRARAPRPPRANFSRADREAVLRESLAPAQPGLDIPPGDSLRHRRAGVPDTVLRRLRRGEFRIDGEIDLHGLRVAQAEEALREFLAAAITAQRQCLRIVHGKGLRSGPRGPVVRDAALALLRRTDRVLAFTSAATRDGGSGATLVLLRAGPRA